MSAGNLGIALVAAAGVAVAAVPARADTDYFGAKPAPTEIKYRKARSRTAGQKLTIGGLAAGGVLAGAVGLYFHLDSRDAADELSADAEIVGTWTADRQATYDRAGSSGIKAIVGYSVGALLLGGAVVALWKTEPGEDEVVLTTRRAAPTLEPVAGGAVVGGVWPW
jgi:hypothetical protein